MLGRIPSSHNRPGRGRDGYFRVDDWELQHYHSRTHEENETMPSLETLAIPITGSRWRSVFFEHVTSKAGHIPAQTLALIMLRISQRSSTLTLLKGPYRTQARTNMPFS